MFLTAPATKWISSSKFCQQKKYRVPHHDVSELCKNFKSIAFRKVCRQRVRAVVELKGICWRY